MVMRRIVFVLGLLIACSGRERENAATKPAADPPPERTAEAPLVTLELALVGEPLREQLAARHDPSSPLVTAEALLAVHHRIAAPWHIYWKNPGDSGLRTRLSLDGVGFEAGQVVYPGPDRFVASGGQVSYGWEREAVLFVPLAAIADDARVQLRSDWLACHESCIPGHTEIAMEMGELDRREDPIIRAMIDRIPEPAGDRLRTSWTDTRLRVEALGGARLLELFPYAHDHAILETVTPTDAALELGYRIDSPPPPDLGQGVVTLAAAGETRWLELAVAWPSP
jgi:hypothetical protein